mgnify:CR=1 FL=1
MVKVSTGPLNGETRSLIFLFTSVFFSALLSTPASTSDASLLFFPGASNNLFAVQGDGGREAWSDSEGSAILTQPKVFEGASSSVLYVIESMDGTVRQHATADGARNWEFNCVDLTGIDSCQDGVEAEFRYVLQLSLSKSSINIMLA